MRGTPPPARRRAGAAVRAAASEDLAEVRSMFREYAQSLVGCHSLEGFQEEVESLPGPYAPPQGRLLIARVGRQAAGCVGLRRAGEGTGEMKRLYVRPAFRGHGVGRALAQVLLAEAKAVGYSRVVLDTLPTMTQARELYRRLGFTAAQPYWENPVSAAIFLEKHL